MTLHKAPPADSRLTRRTLLAGAAAAGASAVLPSPTWGQPASGTGWKAQIANYLLTLGRQDGGFAWPDQPASHLTPTFAAIGCFHSLEQSPPNVARLADFVRTHHPFHIKRLERDLQVFEYQQIQSLLWLNQDASSFRKQVLSWQSPSNYPKQYERHGYPVFQNELKAIICRKLLGLPLDDVQAASTQYLLSRRRDSGAFNNTPADDGTGGHVMNTCWGLEALAALGHPAEKHNDTVDWLRACQLPSGGFTYQPHAEIGCIDDAAYTWAAVKSLKLLGSKPAHSEACVAWLQSLRNADGGFGDRPGWASNPVATYYCLDALAALDALDSLNTAPPAVQSPNRRRALSPELKVFTIQIEAHGQGSPSEAVDLAQSLRIHLWGAKNARPGWIARAQQIADERKVPVTFFVANEEYGTWVDVPGQGTYSHTSDIIAPAGVDFGESLATSGVVSWPDFRQRRLAPLERAGGRLLWQFGENEELTRIFLDDSLLRGGFAAISTFHFGNPDFTNSEPFLMHYRGRLPFVALQDAHGKEPWWFADMTTGFRTVFLATEPTWEGWLHALAQNWVVAIRHDAVSRFGTWMHGGSSEVLEFVRERSSDWQWWDNPPIQRPLVSLVALTPRDDFEVGRPERGLAIRVRCAWENTTQGLPKQPLAEFIQLIVDGQPASPELVAPRRPGGNGVEDHYHLLQLPDLATGKHTATASVRRLSTGEKLQRTIEFVA